VKSCFSCWLVVFDKIAELPSIEKKRRDLHKCEEFSSFNFFGDFIIPIS